jgi:nicotinamide-nucleotide amidase
MEHLVQNDVLPYLRQRLGDEQQFVIKARTLRTVALGESWIDEQIDDLMRAANPTVGLAAHSGIVDIRITARAPVMAEAERMIERMESAVRARLRPLDIFGRDADRLEEVTADALFQAGAELNILESNTAGQIAEGLSAAAAGRAIVKAARIVNGPDGLEGVLARAGGYRQANGWASGETALAAAAALRSPGGDQWGLAVLGDMAARDDVYGGETGQTWAALVTSKTSQVHHYPYGGQGELARQWVNLRIWDLLRRTALEEVSAPGGQGRP